jgi:hypothetical protein
MVIAAPRGQGSRGAASPTVIDRLPIGCPIGCPRLGAKLGREELRHASLAERPSALHMPSMNESSSNGCQLLFAKLKFNLYRAS